MTREERADFWRRRLSSYVPGEIGVIEWCRKNGVDPKSFYHWRRKLAETSAESASVGWLAVADNKRSTPQLLLDPEQSGVTLRIGGATVDVSRDFDARTLGAVVRVLQETSQC